MDEKLEQYNREADRIRAQINAQPLTSFYRLEKSKGGLFVCPVCGSGTNAHKTGALSIRKTDNRVTCFAGQCFGDKGQDTLGALRILHPEKSEREIFTLCGYEMSSGGGYRAQGSAAEDFKEEQELVVHTVPPAEDQGEPAPPPPSFKQEIEQYAAALPGSEGEIYLAGRGLTQETMARFRLGYDAQRHTVTIPYNPQGSYYGRRSTLPDSSRKHDNLYGVPMPLFNAAALYSSEACFVVESPLCAISIAQEGGSAVAISGVGGKTRLIDQLKKKPTAAAIILCLDNDDAGRKATAEIGAELDALQVFCVDGTAAIMGDTQDAQEAQYRKDPNEVLQRSGAEELRRAIEETAAETIRQRSMTAQEQEEERRQRTGAGMVHSFLEEIQTHKYEPVPTGITDIDRALGGGFIRQWLILLGAAPGAGKTALAQWIFEGMAKSGHDCVYLNLEMSRNQVMARSFSRMAARNGHRIRVTDVMQGYKWTEEQRQAIMEVSEQYEREIAPHMVYNPDGVTPALDSILPYLETEAQRAEKMDLPAPFIVLDYLQIVGGNDREDAAAIIKRAVVELKGYAMRHNTVVFVIMAHNRASNSSGILTMESGRDTSALEYSADIQLGLTFTKCLKRGEQKRKDPDELTEEERHYVTMKITKGRFGGTGREVDLYFNGETMTYTQLMKDFVEVQEDDDPFYEKVGAPAEDQPPTGEQLSF